jgi:hypothetical protein
LTFSSPADAQEAIDNFDLNELPGYVGQGKFLKCSIAQPNRFQNEAQGDKKFDRAGEFSDSTPFYPPYILYQMLPPLHCLILLQYEG